MRNNIYKIRPQPVKRQKSYIPLGYNPAAHWVCYRTAGRFTFLPGEVAAELDLMLSFRSIGVAEVFSVEEIEKMRAAVAPFGLGFNAADAFIAGLWHIRREGDVLDDNGAAQGLAA